MTERRRETGDFQSILVVFSLLFARGKERRAVPLSAGWMAGRLCCRLGLELGPGGL